MSVHIDDLRSSQEIVSDVQNLRNVSICELFEEIAMETSGITPYKLSEPWFEYDRFFIFLIAVFVFCFFIEENLDDSVSISSMQ